MQSILIKSVDASNAVAFYFLARRLRFEEHTIATLFKHITGLGEDARHFINAVGSRVLKISEFAEKLGKASVIFLAFMVAIQVLIHYRRGEYGLAFGEVAKTAFSVTCAPAAFFDMIDQLIGFFASDFFQSPYWRAVRMLNGVQGAKHLIDTLVTLGFIFGYAYKHNVKEVENAFAQLAANWESSPFSFGTQVSRDALTWIDTVLPNRYRFEWIQNLAAYNKSHPMTAYKF